MGSLAANLPLASFVFSLRFAGILLGSYVGGRLGGCPTEQYERFWMGFITQARSPREQSARGGFCQHRRSRLTTGGRRAGAALASRG